jgi:hypothetical protein
VRGAPLRSARHGALFGGRSRSPGGDSVERNCIVGDIVPALLRYCAESRCTKGNGLFGIFYNVPQIEIADFDPARWRVAKEKRLSQNNIATRKFQGNSGGRGVWFSAEALDGVCGNDISGCGIDEKRRVRRCHPAGQGFNSNLVRLQRIERSHQAVVLGHIGLKPTRRQEGLAESGIVKNHCSTRACRQTVECSGESCSVKRRYAELLCQSFQRRAFLPDADDDLAGDRTLPDRLKDAYDLTALREARVTAGGGKEKPTDGRRHSDCASRILQSYHTLPIVAKPSVLFQPSRAGLADQR